jgi:hypothetical protein
MLLAVGCTSSQQCSVLEHSVNFVAACNLDVLQNEVFYSLGLIGYLSFWTDHGEVFSESDSVVLPSWFSSVFDSDAGLDCQRVRFVSQFSLLLMCTNSQVTVPGS